MGRCFTVGASQNPGIHLQTFEERFGIDITGRIPEVIEIWRRKIPGNLRWLSAHDPISVFYLQPDPMPVYCLISSLDKGMAGDIF
jgi:hypothetical protein